MQVEKIKSLYNQPNDRGYFGDYGGKFVPEILIPAITALEEEYKKAQNDPEFLNEYHIFF